MTKRDIEYPDLQPFYKEVFHDTIACESVSSEIEFARCFYEEWAGNFLHPLGNDMSAKKLDSILYCYMASQTVTFDWLSHSLIFGHYQSVLRELRTMLENIFYMYSLDIKFRTNSVEGKFKILESLAINGKEVYGKPVFERSGYADWEPSYTLYKQLSKHIHVHAETSGIAALNIAKLGHRELSLIQYDKDSFIQCSRIWRRIAVISVSLALDLCKKLGIEIYQLDMNHLEKTWKS
jgi:hypothetical protein